MISKKFVFVKILVFKIFISFLYNFGIMFGDISSFKDDLYDFKEIVWCVAKFKHKIDYWLDTIIPYKYPFPILFLSNSW